MKSEAFSRIVNGKSIALVGGARGADEQRAAAADIVVRCNLFIGEGGRCDMAWLHGNAPATPPPGLQTICVNLQEAKCVRVLTDWDLSGLTVLGFHAACYRGASPHGREHEWANMFWHQMGSMPLVGVLAARCFTLHEIKSLFVTGFDFYLDDFFHNREETVRTGTVLWRRGPHELATQLHWLRSLEHYDERVTLDPRIHEVAAVVKAHGVW